MKILELRYKGKNTTVDAILTIKPKACLITAGVILLMVA